MRNFRAILHNIEISGVDLAQLRLDEERNKVNRPPANIYSVMMGKLNYIKNIRGENDSIYIKLLQRFISVFPEYKVKIDIDSTRKVILRIFTEGKTDIKHITNALDYFHTTEEFLEIEIEPIIYNENLGDEKVMGDCESAVSHNLPMLTIYVFDRDKKDIRNKAMNDGISYKRWKNNHYSCCIPVPSHRLDHPDDICIEMYYQDYDLFKFDQDGRRLFFSQEFSEITGVSRDRKFMCKDFNKIRKYSIIDDLVFRIETDQKISLTKNDFIENIIRRSKGFENIDFSNFRLIFDLFREIIKDNDAFTTSD